METRCCSVRILPPTRTLRPPKPTIAAGSNSARTRRRDSRAGRSPVRNAGAATRRPRCSTVPGSTLEPAHDVHQIGVSLCTDAAMSRSKRIARRRIEAPIADTRRRSRASVSFRNNSMGQSASGIRYGEEARARPAARGDAPRADPRVRRTPRRRTGRPAAPSARVSMTCPPRAADPC